jgi:hypothetical protein
LAVNFIKGLVLLQDNIVHFLVIIVHPAISLGGLEVLLYSSLLAHKLKREITVIINVDREKRHVGIKKRDRIQSRTKKNK